MKEHEWVTIDVGGELVDVSRDAVKVDGVRRTYTYDEALAEAKALGGELPTPEVLDARWERADLKNAPHTQRLTAGQNDHRLHSSLIDTDIAVFRAVHGRLPNIVGNAGKQWVHTPYAKAAPLYGWFVPPGMKAPAPTHPAASKYTIARVVQQAATDDETFHGRNYKDYSSFGVFMRRNGGRSERVTAPPSAPSMPEPTELGQVGPAVGAWQTWLNANGFGPIKVDNIHGPKETEPATQRWRDSLRDHDTEPKLMVLEPTVAELAPDFRQCRYVARDARGVPVVRNRARLIVLHSIEGLQTAKACRDDMARPDYPRNASAHFFSGPKPGDIWQGVKIENIAGAAPGANHDGIQVEMQGRAIDNTIRGQVYKRTDWLTGEGWATLSNTALLVSALCREEDIPPAILSVEEVLQGKSGITTHRRITTAYKKSSHVDPFGPDAMREAAHLAAFAELLQRCP